MGRMIDPELPWGCWLRMDAGAFVDDETGGRWPSLRAAFWNGRLGMPDVRGDTPQEQLELVHAVLAAWARRSPAWHEMAVDLFEGSTAFRDSVHLWLRGQGLITPHRHSPDVDQLTAEGWSALLMLVATRPYDVRAARPSSATVAMIAGLGVGPDPLQDRIAAVERAATRFGAAFLRQPCSGKPGIVLAAPVGAPVPVTGTVWMVRFETEPLRDGLYGWLCERIDRWQAWADLAQRHGGEALSRKLLEVAAASLAGAASVEGDGSGSAGAIVVV